jgi:hypothetical protein
LGAPDPADLVANSIGAAVGVGLAAIVARVGAESVGGPHGRWSRRRASLLAAAAALAVAGIGWLGLLAGADARQATLARELGDAFAGTTSTAIATRLASDGGFDELLAATASRPSYLGRVGATGMFEARYSVEFFGLHRCVFIRWVTAGFFLRNGSGHECTVFRENPPEQ